MDFFYTKVNPAHLDNLVKSLIEIQNSLLEPPFCPALKVGQVRSVSRNLFGLGLSFVCLPRCTSRTPGVSLVLTKHYKLTLNTSWG